MTLEGDYYSRSIMGIGAWFERDSSAANSARVLARADY